MSIYEVLALIDQMILEQEIQEMVDAIVLEILIEQVIEAEVELLMARIDLISAVVPIIWSQPRTETF